ncbi:retrovirus-related pol polyprotein from transposon TNT 1-94, partial [Tanacetum coccineum]
PLTRITTTTKVSLRKPTALDNETPKSVVTLVYSRKPRKSKTNVPASKSKVVEIVLCVNGKKYILVIVDDCSRFTWVKFLRSKDEVPDFIIKFLKMIQVRLKVPVWRIRIDNGT